ncbi:MAG: extracellular solute-binding protein [Cohnella sp.]|nr:extracellular solute-binding protein [Cohnella sp.]
MYERLRVLYSIALLIALTFGLGGCSQHDSHNVYSPSLDSVAGPSISITLYSATADRNVQEAYKQIADGFMNENPGIAINLSFPGSDYEGMMKVKMAANDMPDIWDTHGWAQKRYGNFLADLRGEEWVSRISASSRSDIIDGNGKVYALVLNEAKDGLTYNAEILKRYDIQPPRTFDELLASAEKIKQMSNGAIMPFYFSGIDDWMVGQFFDYFATPLFVHGSNYLSSKNMDWSKWASLADRFLQMKSKGYMNEDALTADYADLVPLFAEGKVVYAMLSPQFSDEVLAINPNAQIGLMPIPSLSIDDEPSFSGGERLTMGAWKDSPHLAEAKKVIAYFARPESMSKFAEATKLPPGLINVQASHEFTPYYDLYRDVKVFPYFDRVYLPNGMWEVMSESGAELLAGQLTPEGFAVRMRQETERLSE